MAEALYALGEGLHWSPASAPRGEFVVLRDHVDADGAFLVHHFLALFLKAGHRVCFINCSHSKEHYAAVGRKLGVNLPVSIGKGALKWMDCFHTPVESLTDLFREIRHEVTAMSETATDTPVSIIIDELSTLKWQFERRQVVQFLRCCRALTHTSQGRASVVVLSHADTDEDVSTSADHLGTPRVSWPLQSLSLFLTELSTVTITAAPLPTGYLKDVDGTLTVQRQCQGLGGIFDASIKSYKVVENTIKCFASGGDALLQTL